MFYRRSVGGDGERLQYIGEGGSYPRARFPPTVLGQMRRAIINELKGGYENAQTVWSIPLIFGSTP